MKKDVNIKLIPIFFYVNNFILLQGTPMNTNITVNEVSGRWGA